MQEEWDNHSVTFTVWKSIKNSQTLSICLMSKPRNILLCSWNIQVSVVFLVVLLSFFSFSNSFSSFYQYFIHRFCGIFILYQNNSKLYQLSIFSVFYHFLHLLHPKRFILRKRMWHKLVVDIIPSLMINIFII